MPDMANDDQRWLVYDLFTKFGLYDVDQMCADAMRILKLDYLGDLRNLTASEADELIGELRRALAAKQVSSD